MRTSQGLRPHSAPPFSAPGRPESESDDVRNPWLHRSCPPTLIAAVLLAGTIQTAPAAPGPAARASVLPDITLWLRQGGRPSRAAWRHAARFSIPYEISPEQNGRAPVSTRVQVGYTAKALWLRFLAHDPHPAHIGVHYREHDDISDTTDDYVGVYLSPFDDPQWAYEFRCTAGGVEWDAFQLQSNQDSSWNAVWDCRARRTHDGYEVVMRIPFASIKFPHSDRPQRWGMLFFRNWPRSLRHELFSRPIDFNSNCTLCSMQVVRTATPVMASPADLQLIPALTLMHTDSPGTTGTALSRHTTKLEASLDANWALSPDLQWSATVNPNFSQISPDVLQLSVNRQFALDYAENRPFFEQGTDVFDTPKLRMSTDGFNPSGQLVDTLTIADPRWASKLTGQVGPNAVGALVTDDQTTDIMLPGPQVSTLKSFNFATHDALLRYRRDFGPSEVGVLATKRSGGGYDNGVYELDSQWQIDPSDMLTTVVSSSSTTYPDGVAKALGATPGTTNGVLWLADFTRSRHNYYFDINALHISNGFRADLGYLPQVGYDQLAAQGEYDFYAPDTNWWQNGGFGVLSNDTETVGNGPALDRKVTIYTFLQTHYQADIYLYATREEQYFKGKAFGLDYYQIDATAQPTDWLNGQIDVVEGGGVDYIGVRQGRMLTVTTTLAITPGRHLTVNLVNEIENFSLANQRLFTADLYDLRLAWYFNTHLFVNAIGQEQDVRNNVALYPAGTPRRSRSLATQWQIGYQINPWTVFYAGSSQGFQQGPGNSLLPERRAYYVKVSYYFRP